MIVLGVLELIFFFFAKKKMLMLSVKTMGERFFCSGALKNKRSIERTEKRYSN